MEKSQSAENEAEDVPKKSPFDNMSHEELIKKCKGLLAIAQKAKLARDASVEETRALKEDLKNFEQQRKSDKECLKTMQEMVDSLTEYKLECTITLDSLKKTLTNSEAKYDSLNRNNKLNEERLSQLDTENLSYKRQVARLTDENDKLLQELDILEKSREDNTERNIQELEEKLKIVLEENKVLMSEKLKIGKEITAITSEVAMKTEETIDVMKNISTDNSDLYKSEKLIESLQTELIESRNYNSLLKSDLENLQIKISNLEKQLTSSLERRNEMSSDLKIMELKQALQTKNKENETLLEELNKNILEVSELGSKLTYVEILQTQTAAENEKLQNKVKNMEMEYEENNKLIKNLKIELAFQISKLTAEKDEADCKVKKAESDTSKEQQNKQNLEKQIEELNNTIALSTRKLQELQKQNNDFERKNKANMQKLTKMKTENEKHSKVIDELKHQLGESYNSKRQLEDELNKLQSASKYLEDAQIVEKNLIIDKLESSIEEMKAKIIIAEQEINSAKSNYDKLNANYELMTLNKEKLISKLKMYHHKLTEFASNLKQLKSDKNMLLETMKDYSNTISDWQNKIATISSQLCDKLIQCNIESKILHDRITVLEAEKENLLAGVKNDGIQSLEQLENENIELNEQIKSINAEQVEFLKTQLINYEIDKEKLNTSNNDLLTKLQVLSNDNSKMSEEIKKLLEQKNVLEENIETLNNTASDLTFLKNNNSTLKLDNENLLKELNEIRSAHSKLEPLETEVVNIRQQLSNKTSENRELLMEMREINEVLKQRGETISKQQEYCGELEKKIQTLENDIKQLYFKLNDKDSQLNETYTQVQENEHKIKEQALKTDQTKNIVQEKDEVIQTLQEELNKLKDKLNNTMSTDCQSDVLSTSTISKLEESSRFKDVDSSLEERYSKMRMLALKFKKKVTEQITQITTLEAELQKLVSERNEVSGKVPTNAKNMQILQQEYDKLQDQLEDQKAKNKATEKSASSLQEEYNKLKLELENTKDRFSKSQSNIELSKKEKSSSDSANKEYKSLIYNLKKNLDDELQNSTRQQEEIKKLQDKLKSSELQIAEQNSKIKSLKDELLESKKELKRKSVLNLEMDNYEKTLNDVAKRLDVRNGKIKELESAISSNSDTISSLKEQIKLLEANLESEVSHSKDLKDRLNTTQSALNESEHQNSLKESEISQLKRNVENLTAKVEELGLELTNSVAEKEISITSYKSEKDSLLRQTYEMENAITILTENLNKCKNELMDVKADFSSYKVRAQSVLRQNQFKDVSKEDELLEEIKLITANNEALSKDLNNKSKQFDLLNKEYKLVQEEKENSVTRCNELLGILDEIRLQHDMLLEANQKINMEHQETIKAQKLQNDTLVNCYKQQIVELQEQNKKQLDDSKIQLQQSLTRKKSIRETHNSEQMHSEHIFTTVQEENIINIALMERGDGEGSESTHSMSPTNAPQRQKSQIQSRSNREIIPLDELLNSSMSDNNTTDMGDNEDRLSPTTELHNVKQHLNVEQSRVKHLSGLLAENEQDLAKLTQLNEVLKEEIRRSQRSEEREKHTQNSEYLKNVIFKFVTSNNGDEKSHLVPVLNMLLKLSPEESQKLQDISKGIDSSAVRGWGTYLPRWSNQP